ncbi:MAG: TonB-dependent receptor [Candidatus Cloacimonetes bacterium]|nr:TonB-dependent receptor [Candidatus Cloacimonadota bacterium]
MLRKITIFMVLSILISLPVFAGTTGRLAGKITDEKKNPVSFANVILEGTQIGAQSNEKGAYIIINIPPGTYNVIFQQMGYKSKKLTGVKINIDETIIKNITLETSAIEIPGYTVEEDEIEQVSATKTSSGKTLTAESIEDLGIDDIDDIIALQAGVKVVDGEVHVRGGRGNEVSYSVDGMSVSDPVDGGASLTIDSDAIAQTKVMTGGFPAEFGNAQSGVVNIITKDGTSYYTGKVEFVTDHLILEENSNSDVMKFALGGPLLTPVVSDLRENLTFFINGSANWYDTRYKDHYESDPFTDLGLTHNNYPASEPYKNREDILGFDFGSNRNFNDYNLNFKTKYSLSATKSLTFAIRGDQNTRDHFAYRWKYALDHYYRSEGNQKQYILTYDTMIGTVANLKVKASLYGKQFKQYPKGISRDSYFGLKDSWNIDYNNMSAADSMAIIDGVVNSETIGNPATPIWALTPDGKCGIEHELGLDNLYDWAYNDDGGVLHFIDENNEFERPGTIGGSYIDDENKIFTLRTDFEYQYGLIHTIKSGFEVMKHYIKKDQLVNPWEIDSYRFDEYLRKKDPLFHVEEGDVFYIETATGVDSTVVPKSMDLYSAEDYYNAVLVASGTTDGYEANPWQGALYFQDAMQWEGMNVNAGLRFDFWYLGNDYKKIQNDGSFVIKEFENDEKFRLMLSPRLGISHPISETSVLHFAYNYQNQLPQMQYIFTSKSPFDAITGTAENTIIGNPKLDPQITVTYEVGLSKGLGENYSMDVTAYYKNIYNYVNYQKVFLQDDDTLIPYSENPNNQSIPMYRYISEDYGSVRGIDINLSRNLANFISGSTSYSLAWAQGNNSEAGFQDEATNLREFALDWDNTHTFNFNLIFKVGNDEEWYIPATDFRFPLDDFSVSFNYDLSSGKPYTPANSEGDALDINSERQDFTETARLQFNKKINFTQNSYLKMYMKINNLFNKTNVYRVYAISGSPYYDGVDLTDGGNNYVSDQEQAMHDLSTKNPSNVSSGRTITVGMSYNW